MAILGNLKPQTTNDVLVYTVPNGRRTICNLNVVNTHQYENVNISLALMKSNFYALSSVSIENKGSNYTQIPEVIITGENEYNAVISVQYMEVETLLIDNRGQNYLVDDEVEINITNAEENGKCKLKITEVDENGSVLNFIILDRGLYTSLGNVGNGVNGNGTGLSVNNIKYSINSLLFINSGNGYKTKPTIEPSFGNAIFDCQITQKVEDYKYFEYNLELIPSGVIERTGLPLSSGDSIFIKTNIPESANIHVWGFEEIE